MAKQDDLSLNIFTQLAENNNFLPFDRFMTAALYEPGLGYYESAEVFGGKGDFVTGSDLGPWLALGFSDLLKWGWENLGRPAEWTLLEQGSGSGRLLADVLGLLHASDMVFPSSVIAVERSAQMRARQKGLFDSLELSVHQQENLEAVEVPGPCLMISNELPDAFPVKCFTWKQGRFFERGVGMSGDGTAFVWRDADQPLDAPPDIDSSLIAEWPEGYVGEWCPSLSAWQKSVSRTIRQGYVFTVDYGYAQRELYRPGRLTGTLMGHAGHQTSEDVLSGPGSMDITAHVDFTAMAKAGLSAGLVPTCWMSQGAWLAQSPAVQERLQKLAMSGKADDVATLAQAKRMLLPFGMGETFKLLVQAHSAEIRKPDYLQQFDKLSSLQL